MKQLSIAERFLQSQKLGKLVVVDIQPAHAPSFSDDLAYKVAEQINNSSSVLILFNGPSLGYEDLDTLVNWFEEHGADLSRTQFVEKDYGFFRSWMGVVPDDKIIEVAKEMIKRGIWDSRDLPEELIPEGTHKEDPLYLPDSKVLEGLKKFNGATMVGGACGECLAEVLLLAEVLGLKFSVDHSLTY